jgi:hypothetical protein
VKVDKCDKPNKIIMAVTFRHYFIGLGVALNDKNSNYHLVFINQKYDDERNPILLATSKLIRPFLSVRCLPLNSTGVIKKFKNRRVIFSILKEMLDDLKPVEILTGNDRRIEYQYAMHYMRNKLLSDVIGGYLDNGVGSYVDFHKLEYRKMLARKWIDIPIKKLVFGTWYNRMQCYGGSDWTDVCYLTHPQYAPDKLKKKQCVVVDIKFYLDANFKYISELNNVLGLNSDVSSDQSILLVLPKAPAMELIYGSIELAEETIKNICKNYKNIYVKYHPADLGDILNFSDTATILPNQVPVELLFMVMNFAKIIGDGSTAVFSAKWMLPRANVSYFDIDTPYIKLLKDIFEDMDITPIGV